MKRFNFAFDKLLSYRLFLEKEEESKFALILKEYIEITNVISEADKKSIKILNDSRAFISSGNMDMLHYGEQARIGLKFRIGDYENKKKAKSIPLEAARKKLIEARKNRKAVEILKEKEWEKYTEDMIKEEQEQIDEFASLQKVSFIYPS